MNTELLKLVEHLCHEAAPKQFNKSNLVCIAAQYEDGTTRHIGRDPWLNFIAEYEKFTTLELQAALKRITELERDLKWARNK